MVNGVTVLVSMPMDLKSIDEVDITDVVGVLIAIVI